MSHMTRAHRAEGKAGASPSLALSPPRWQHWQERTGFSPSSRSHSIQQTEHTPSGTTPSLKTPLGEGERTAFVPDGQEAAGRGHRCSRQVKLPSTYTVVAPGMFLSILLSCKSLKIKYFVSPTNRWILILVMMTWQPEQKTLLPSPMQASFSLLLAPPPTLSTKPAWVSRTLTPTAQSKESMLLYSNCPISTGDSSGRATPLATLVLQCSHSNSACLEGWGLHLPQRNLSPAPLWEPGLPRQALKQPGFRRGWQSPRPQVPTIHSHSPKTTMLQ